MKKLFLFLGLIALTMPSFAQSKGKISGSLLDEKKTVLPFANVLLLKAKDSTLAKASISDTDGKYQLEQIADGQYLISVSMVGYKKYFTPKITISADNQEVKIQPIQLEQDTQTLKEVTVSAKKPFIEQQIDRTVLNVENSIVSSGSNVLEILEKAPAVIIDRQNSQIKLKGKSGVIVMIDNKISPLSGEDLQSYLQNLNSDQIEKIEMITNPSSKYDASGNSGIINIKLKRNKAFGTNGSISAGITQGLIPDLNEDLTRANTSLNLNHRNKSVNIFGNLNVRRSRFFSGNDIYRIVNFEGTRSVFDNQSTATGGGYGETAKIGLDYFATKKTTLGVMLDVNNNNNKRVGRTFTDISETKNNITQNRGLSQLNDGTGAFTNIAFNGNLKHNFDDKGKEMTIDLDYSNFVNNREEWLNTDYLDNSAIVQQRNLQPSKINIYAVKTDFTIPLKDNLKIETGAKFSYVNSDNDLQFDQKIDNQWKADLTKTNHFIYTENVNAAYMNVSKQWKKIGIQGGLRAEHTHSIGNSVTLSDKRERNYISLFPTFFLNQTIDKNNAIRYSYSRRIDRPNYQQLNPFLFFLDPYTYKKGNPYLQPQFTNNVEVSYTYKGAMTVGLSYSRTNDFMLPITEQDDAKGVTYATDINLDGYENYALNLTLPIPIAKWWMMQNNINFFYNQFKDDNLLGGVLNVGTLAYGFNTSSSITMKKGWTGELSAWFQSPQAFGIFRNDKPQYAINAGLQKQLFNKKASLRLNVNDIFLTSWMVGSAKYQNMDLKINSKWLSRTASATFTYRFGNQNVKAARRRGTALDSEKRRAGSGEN